MASITWAGGVSALMLRPSSFPNCPTIMTTATPCMIADEHRAGQVVGDPAEPDDECGEVGRTYQQGQQGRQ